MSELCPVLVVNDTRIDGHHGCTAVMVTLERLLEGQGMTIIGRWPAHAEWRNNPSFERLLARARLVVINGEGTIHHDRPAGRCLLEIGAAAKAVDVPVALVNTGWEANGPEFTALLRNFTLVAARDKVSAAEMRMGANELRVVPDLSLCTIPPILPGRREGVGVTDNVDRFRALDLIRLRRVIGAREVSIHHRSPWASFLRAGFSLRADLYSPMRLVRLLMLRHAMWRVSQNELDRFLAELAGLDFLVSGRFHACTLALVVGTPFIAQASNTNKIARLVDDIGLAPERATFSTDTTLLTKLAEEGWNQEEKEARLAYLEHARSQAADLAVDLRLIAR